MKIAPPTWMPDTALLLQTMDLEPAPKVFTGGIEAFLAENPGTRRVDPEPNRHTRRSRRAR